MSMEYLKVVMTNSDNFVIKNIILEKSNNPTLSSTIELIQTGVNAFLTDLVTEEGGTGNYNIEGCSDDETEEENLEQLHNTSSVGIKRKENNRKRLEYNGSDGRVVFIAHRLLELHMAIQTTRPPVALYSSPDEKTKHWL